MSLPYMQLFVADYLGDTRHLTCEQHGAYLLLLMTMWRHDGYLPDDDKKLARICCLTVKRWNVIKDDILEFCDVENGRISQQRILEELQKGVSKSKSRSLAGKQGGIAKALKTKKPPLAKATVLPKHLSEPDIKEKEIDKSISKKSEKIPEKIPRRKPEIPLPPDWHPPEEFIQLAVDKNLSVPSANHEAEKFKYHALTHDRRCRDWKAAFQNWINKAIEINPAINKTPHQLVRAGQ